MNEGYCKIIIIYKCNQTNGFIVNMKAKVGHRRGGTVRETTENSRYLFSKSVSNAVYILYYVR